MDGTSCSNDTFCVVCCKLTAISAPTKNCPLAGSFCCCCCCCLLFKTCGLINYGSCCWKDVVNQYLEFVQEHYSQKLFPLSRSSDQILEPQDIVSPGHCCAPQSKGHNSVSGRRKVTSSVPSTTQRWLSIV